MAGQTFQVGQRWANTAETELGVGIVTQINTRTVAVFFPEAETSRQYATRGAPLVRIEYQVGDLVESPDGQKHLITSVEERNGLFFYQVQNDAGESSSYAETQLKSSRQHSEPLTRLLQGQNDSYQNFSLRLATWEARHHYQKLAIAGLIGTRTQLIPHQYNIAHTVTQSRYPRVMLADEVGLGKTIEAGLIAHRLLLNGQIQRMLILVPESLTHQWLVEMLRRFNLRVRLLNPEQCEAICESESTDNPFNAEQLVLCSLDFLLENPERQKQVMETPWDLLIIDEAHHLAWHPDGASEKYTLAEQLSTQIPGLLLLTATPEKEGHASHFAQLHLVDPQRYHDFDAFVAGQQQFGKIAELTEKLFDSQLLSETEQKSLRKLLPDATSQDLIEQLMAPDSSEDDARLQRLLVQRLIDRHGTGRALYRNTRATIPGFPTRKALPEMLPWPDEYRRMQRPNDNLPTLLYPEDRYASEEWLTFDPRVPWLIELLKKHRTQKFLVLCHHADTALALGEHLSLRAGIRATTFQEGLTLIERDRAAAWFADLECGAQVLICSEIGSEGRNFQFCHHLIMFDLPVPIDLLEQRIGRLDRIGQQHDIQIHIPVLEGSPQAQVFRWYHEGFNAFLLSKASHTVVYDEFCGDIALAIRDETDINPLIEKTHARVADLDEQFQRGRNRLLAFHSKGDPEVTEALLDTIRDEDESAQLAHYMDCVFTQFGIEEEELSDRHFILRPGTHFEESQFGFLNEEGLSATYDRDTALARDDVAFFTWDHPLVQAAQDLIITSRRGSASLALLKNRQIREGTLLIEAIFVLECVAPVALQLHRYLPATPIRILLDPQKRDLSATVKSAMLDKQLKNVKGEIAGPLIQQVKSELQPLLDDCQKIAEQRSRAIIESTLKNFSQSTSEEIERMEALQREQAPISDRDIHERRELQRQGLDLLRERTRVQLDALRLMITIN
ncbi:Superfamily II DNA/RNA helicases, SNF2 family [gamma proteobacterium HdN1]|nr:Superfamily II DNA/RNA helicases, SNF2 family [gamma proteobacterium HdN1]